MEFNLTDEYIELYKLLKLMTDVENGAEAKMLIAEGLVSRNGEIETRKRAKIRENDLITVGEYSIKITNK
jgi:ribosome-associated protein